MKNFVQVRIESSAFEPDAVQIVELTGRETISRLFEFKLHLATAGGNLDEDKLLTSAVTLVFERRVRDSSEAVEIRRITGIVHTILDRALGEGPSREYVVTMVPRAWMASLASTSDVCMDLSIPDIITQKLTEGAGLKPGTDVELRLTGTYAPREFVVQYKETHLAFVSRLAEDLGIHFFFEDVKGKEVMVFADANSAFKPAEPASCAFTPRGEHVDVYELEAQRQLVTKNFVARDYNYRNPSMDVLGEAQLSVLGSGKYDEYGPHAKTPAEAAFYARVRAEEAGTHSLTFAGRSDQPGLRAGSTLTIEGHPRGDLDIVVTEVHHQITQSVFGQHLAKQKPYANTFHGLPKKVVYRPARLTPKPVVNSVLTGVVEAAAATDVGAVDDQGRYRVMFMYDSVTGRGDGKASRPLRMSQPSASADRGFHVPLKTGTEVLIFCVNGDPDRPIIAGAVPNPQTPSPVTISNAERTILKTNHSSLTFDDHSIRLKLSVNVENHVIQMGQPESPELGIVIGTVDNHTEVANKDKTETSKEKSVYTDELTVLAAKNIIEAAGIPNPMSLWNKLEEAADKVEKYVKQVGDIAEEALKQYDEHFGHAKKNKDEAEKKLKDAIKEAKDLPAKRTKEAKAKVEETKEKLKKELKVKEKTQPKAVTDPQTGAVRQETQAEAEQRTFKEEVAKDPKAKDELKSANDHADAAKAAEHKADEKRKPLPVVDPTTGNTRHETKEEADQRSFEDELKHDPEAHKDVKSAADNAVDAQDAYEDFLKPVVDGEKDANKLAHDGVAKFKQVGEDLEKGKVGTALKDAHLIGGGAAKVIDKLANVKAVQAAIKKIPVVGKVISAVSKVFTKAAQEAFDATVSSSQVLAVSIPKLAKQRRPAKVGSFSKPFNIQLSRGSASLYGVKDGFVFGGHFATVFSPMNTSILGTKRVDVKSQSLVEVAAKEVVLTAGELVDVHASSKLKLVAHSGDKSIEIPGGHTMFFHSKEGIMMDSVEKDIVAKAKKNVKVTAEEENIELTAKKRFKLTVQDEDLDVRAKGKIELISQEGSGLFRVNKKLVLESTDDDFTLVCKKKGIVKGAEELSVQCKSGTWDSSKELQLTTKKCTVDASNNFTVNSKKIELG